jgi:hypothetical protein
MTEVRKLKERIKTVKEIQADYSPTSDIYKKLQGHLVAYQNNLVKAQKVKDKKDAAKLATTAYKKKKKK